jgi:hypothetical protein
MPLAMAMTGGVAHAQSKSLDVSPVPMGASPLQYGNGTMAPDDQGAQDDPMDQNAAPDPSGGQDETPDVAPQGGGDVSVPDSTMPAPPADGPAAKGAQPESTPP